jgi:hypothetical protein
LRIPSPHEPLNLARLGLAPHSDAESLCDSAEPSPALFYRHLIILGFPEKILFEDAAGSDSDTSEVLGAINMPG